MFLLIGLSLMMAGGFLAAFFWAMRNGQYEDTDTPALRILFEDNHVLIQPADCDNEVTEKKTTTLTEVNQKTDAGSE